MLGETQGTGILVPLLARLFLYLTASGDTVLGRGDTIAQAV